jgi:hypothetical protein
MHIQLSKAQIETLARKRDEGMKPMDARKETDLAALMLIASARGHMT